MSEAIVHFVGNRQPPLEATLSTDGSGDPLPAGATVTFSMRPVGSTTLKVSAASANVVSEPLNQVSYAWAAGDVDTADFYLGWWTVTATGQSLDTPEFLIEIRAHATGEKAYLELEEAKSTLEIDSAFADLDIQRALVSASRGIDEATSTRFFTTASDEVRYYTPTSPYVLFPDEINDLTELATADSGGTTFSTVWTENDDFVLEPLNATVGLTQYRPWNTIRVASRGSNTFAPYARSVRLTGKFGWPEPPENVRVATGIIATKIMIRARQAPLGVISAFDGTAVRIARFDPQVDELLTPYNQSTPFA
jgi:hypothetical protein